MSSDVNFMLSDAKTTFSEKKHGIVKLYHVFLERRNKMKKILKTVASTLMTGISAFVISGMTGSTCVFLLHQPELPEQLDQLRK